MKEGRKEREREKKEKGRKREERGKRKKRLVCMCKLTKILTIKMLILTF